jgi:hypothetical protein
MPLRQDWQGSPEVQRNAAPERGPEPPNMSRSAVATSVPRARALSVAASRTDRAPMMTKSKLM